MKSLLGQILAQLIVLIAHVVTAVRPNWIGCSPENRVRVYCPNHSSNGDFVLVWAALPPAIRRQTRPVAALDYWLESKLRAFTIRYAFRGILINRNKEERKEDPIALMSEAIDNQQSIIIFPEGGRNMSDEPLMPLKSGIFHLANARPEIEFVPVWIHNLNRALPKGEVIPLPLICTVTFGTPVTIAKDETKDDFLERVKQGMLKAKAAKS